MFIKDILKKRKPTVSFEVFPPKRNYPLETVYKTIDELKIFKPDFISVTYGAGGGTKDRTVEIAATVKNKLGIETVAHLTCVTSTKQEIESILSELKQHNIENILALRGDIPQDPNFKFPNPLHYQFAKDLVYHIRQKDNFCIGGAAYPEGHIECPDPNLDICHLKEKVDAGLDFLITQLFFDNTFFYKFMEKVRSSDINIPVIAGIMPVSNKKQIERIVSLCGASIPDKLGRLLEKFADNPQALKQAGIAYATDQIIDLLAWGVDGIHIYTMNRPEITAKIMENISAIRRSMRTES